MPFITAEAAPPTEWNPVQILIIRHASAEERSAFAATGKSDAQRPTRIVRDKKGGVSQQAHA